MSSITADRLIAACAEDGSDAGISIRTDLEPLAGDGAPVKPATYAGGVFQRGRRWWGEGESRREVDTISLDNVPSQANRLEEALLKVSGILGLPEFVLDLTSLEPLPPHVPRELSSFTFPHRNADAYLRDSAMDGTDFLKSDVGRAVFAATGQNADALLEWFPQALLFGFWQSHLGKKGSQAKLARSWVSEIIGISPAFGGDEADPPKTEGLKGDPLNLVKEGNTVDMNPNDLSDYAVLEAGEKPVRGERKDLSEIGHGQVPVSPDKRSLAAVSFDTIVQQSTVSFASLRRIHVDDNTALARAYLAALGLLAHSAAFGRSFNLRSGCDLRPRRSTWIWLGSSDDEDLAALSLTEATELFREVRTQAVAAGLPVEAKPSPVALEPRDSLAKVIRNTFPAPDAG